MLHPLDVLEAMSSCKRKHTLCFGALRLIKVSFYYYSRCEYVQTAYRPLRWRARPLWPPLLHICNSYKSAAMRITSGVFFKYGSRSPSACWLCESSRSQGCPESFSPELIYALLMIWRSTTPHSLPESPGPRKFSDFFGPQTLVRKMRGLGCSPHKHRSFWLRKKTLHQKLKRIIVVGRVCYWSLAFQLPCQVFCFQLMHSVLKVFLFDMFNHLVLISPLAMLADDCPVATVLDYVLTRGGREGVAVSIGDYH